MALTLPLSPTELASAYPAETSGMAPGKVAAWLEMLEGALRAEYRVTRTDADADDALRQAMLIAWPAFLAQVRVVATESVSTAGASQSYATGAERVRFPASVAALLAPVAEAGANTIRLLRG